MINAALRAIAIAGTALAMAGCTTGLEGDRGNIPLTASAEAKLERMGSSPGAPMLLRIYKKEGELEVWKKTASGSYEVFNTYEICAWSGELGPKVSEGDRQAPEGFYTITPGLMNPRSNYHLAFNLGYPNAFDRALGRTGSNLMVHGDCSSAGCYAMTNEQIEEIYALARETFRGGNSSFQAQLYPFRMTPENFAEYNESEHIGFWNNLKLGYQITEVTGEPPALTVCDGEYNFNAASACGVPELSNAQRLRLASVQAADTSAVANAIEALEEKARQAVEEEALRIAEAEAAEERAAAREAEAEQRRDAISGFAANVTGFFGGLFGGGEGQAEPVQPVTKPPLPPIRPERLS